jgi:hypothetical protein
VNNTVDPLIRVAGLSGQSDKRRGTTFFLSIIVFILSLAYTLFSLYSYSFPSLGLPAFLRIPRIIPGYADLRQLTYTSGCNETFSDLLSGAVICDPWDRPFNYPWLSLKVLRLLGVSADTTEFLGGLLGLFSIAITLIFIFSILKSPAIGLWLSSILLLSFPFQFALERGNYELIVFCGSLMIPFVLFSPWFSRFLAARGVVAALLSFSVTVLKIHPVAGLAPWALGLAITWPEKKATWIPILILILSSLGIIIQIGDIPLMLANTPNSDGWLGFGLLASYQSKRGNSFGFLVTLVKIIIIFVSAKYFIGRSLKLIYVFKPYSKLEEYSRQSSLLFSIMFLAIWIISKSWDYRLIFIFGIVPFFINKYSSLNPHQKIILKLVGCGTIFVLFEGYAAGGLTDYGARIGRLLGFISNVAVQPVLIGFLVAFLLRNRAHLAPPLPLQKT